MTAGSADSRATPSLADKPTGRRWIGSATGFNPSARGLRIAQFAAVVGLLYAEISLYWGLGGTWLLNTIGAQLKKQGRAGNGLVVFALWTAVVLKVVASALPLLALRQLPRPAWRHMVWVLACVEAGILTVYGLVLTTAGLLVQTDVIHAPVTADHRALAWHAYLWDPWFLIWGLLVTVALLRGIHRNSSGPHPLLTESSGA
jgi:Protein of unknown function (DUF3995)